MLDVLLFHLVLLTWIIGGYVVLLSKRELTIFKKRKKESRQITGSPLEMLGQIDEGEDSWL